MGAELVLRARKDTVRHFLNVGATSADAAVTYQPQRHLQRRALAYLLGKQVVRLGADGCYWLDEAAASAWKLSTRNKAALVAGGLVAAGVAIFFASRRGKQD